MTIPIPIAIPESDIKFMDLPQTVKTRTEKRIQNGIMLEMIIASTPL